MTHQPQRALSKTKLNYTSGVSDRYLVERQAVAEDEVDGALDVAVFEVVAARMVVQSVLAAHEAAAVERRCVPCDPQRHCLLPYCSRWRDGRRVLPTTPENVMFSPQKVRSTETCSTNSTALNMIL
jgi:hypothetical protein